MRKRPLFLCAVVFLLGLISCRQNRQELIWLVLIWLLYEWKISQKNKKKMLLAGRCVLLLSAFFLGFFHMSEEESFRQTYLTKMKNGQQVTVWGEVIKTEFGERQNSIYLSDCVINLEGETFACNEVIVYSSKSRYFVGEIHKIKGEVQLFEGPGNEGGFDRRTYYQSLKIDFAVQEKQEVLLSAGENSVRQFLLSFKEKMGQVYQNHTTERAAGFLSGMILGDKSGLEKDLKDLFTDGGLAHILAISGLHVSIVGQGLYRILRNRRQGFLRSGVVAGLVLLAYCFMVGSGMSAVRAVGMMLLLFTAQFLGRSYDMLNSLGAMVLYLLWDNPFLIEYSGFWFSIMALIGVGYVGSIWGKFGMSVGITLTTLPLVAMSYYEIPLYAPITNFLLLPLLTPIFTLALFAGITGAVSALWLGNGLGGLVTILLLPCQWGLQFYEWACGFIEGLPFSIIITGKPSEIEIGVYYAVLFLGTYYIKRKCMVGLKGAKEEATLATNTSAHGGHGVGQQNKSENEKGISSKGYRLGFLMGIVCLMLIIYPKPQPKEISFLDVGQGDGIHISTGEGINFFIDGGSAFSDSLGEYTILPFLKSKGIRKIDYWFISHADKDHISGVLEVLESGYCVEHLVVSELSVQGIEDTTSISAAKEDDRLLRLLSAARENGTKIILMKAGNILRFEGGYVKCLYPGSQDVNAVPDLATDRNEGSLVLELNFEQFGEVRDFRAFFSGDISSEVEEYLVSCNDGTSVGTNTGERAENRTGNRVEDRVGAWVGERIGKVWLYKAAHHGSRHSNSLEFLQVLSPEVAVVSCSKNNTYGHPSPDAISRIEQAGAKIYYTMDMGQVTIRERGGKLVVAPGVPANPERGQ